MVRTPVNEGHYLPGSAIAARMTTRVIDAGARASDDGLMTNTSTSTNTDTSTSTADAGPDVAAIVDLHLRAYCEPDAARRAALVAQAWSADGVLIDPPFDGTGHDGIAAMADVVLTHYPAHTFRRTTAVDAHHTFARYGWSLEAPDGTIAVTGTDVVEMDDDGRLQRIVGFFGELA
jgi:hypothetical protein